MDTGLTCRWGAYVAGCSNSSLRFGASAAERYHPAALGWGAPSPAAVARLGRTSGDTGALALLHSSSRINPARNASTCA